MKTGTRLGPYEILGPLGAGGMGEVYRARDHRLNRDVAIKVLPERVAKDPVAQARFEREAKAVAALSHPNILAIHDVGTGEGTLYSVTEMLEGETLRKRMEGPVLPLRKAVDFGIQISRGLAAAHDRGIVHRDLKPENIFLTKDGLAKILDFGLAKAMEPQEAEGLTGLPTRGPGTEPGTVMGTVGYMSPEQVRGQALDARSDLFSFGAVLYEMLSGRKAFAADTAADTMTAILREEPPDLAVSGRSVPPALDRIIRHCLEKNPADRFQATRDLVFSLEAVTEHSASGPAAAVAVPQVAGAPRRVIWLTLGGLAAGLFAGAALALWLGRSPSPEPPTFRYLSYSGFDSDPAASPDGRLIAYASIRDGRSRIWLKQHPGGDEIVLTDGPDDFPRISPDGSLVLFIRTEGSQTSVYRVPIVGGEPRKILDDVAEADWSPDGRQIVFLRTRQSGDTRLSKIGVVEVNGNEPHEIAGAENVHLLAPRWSPDGRTIAAVRSPGENSANSILLVGPDGKNPRTLEPPPPARRLSSVAWSGSGASLVYAQSESIVTLNAQTSPARIIRQDVRSGHAETLQWIPVTAPVVDIIGPGRLVLGTLSPRQNLVEVPLGGEPGLAAKRWLTRGSSVDRQPAYSPDGEWILFTSSRSGNLDLWKLSLASGAVRRITEDPAEDWDPAFSPDGKSILWSSSRSGHFEIWICAADGTGARQLTNDGEDAENPSMTADGRWVVYNSSDPAKSGIWKIHPDGTGAKRFVPGSWSTPEVSPDGRYVAYRTQTTGVPRIVGVARIEDGRIEDVDVDPLWNNSAGRPRWAPDGKSLTFTGTNAAGVRGVLAQLFFPGRATRGSLRELFAFDPSSPVESYAFSPDGRRVVYSSIETLNSLMLAEGLPGVTPPDRRPSQ